MKRIKKEKTQKQRDSNEERKKDRQIDRKTGKRLKQFVVPVYIVNNPYENTSIG